MVVIVVVFAIGVMITIMTAVVTNSAASTTAVSDSPAWCGGGRRGTPAGA
jgi:hypothetical protein